MTELQHTVTGLADLYEWGYPLVQVHRTRAAHGVTPGLVARTRLSDARDRTVVAPNNDTLYSSGFFDLGRGPLTIEVAPMDHPDRYWSVMLLDAYTNVSYVSRRTHGTDGATVQVVFDATGGPPNDGGVGGDVVQIGTPTVWVLTRVLVDDVDDLPAVRRAQAAIRVVGDERVAAGPPIGTDPHATSPSAFFADLRHALAIDPPAPWHPQPPDGAARLLTRLPPDDALADAVALATHRIDTHRFADRHGNGWGTRRRGAAFDGDIRYRAAVAKFSLAAHLPAENRSYHRRHDGSAPVRLRLGAGEPAVGAFWSLTAYGTDGFFVPNDLDRFSISDRTAGLQRDPDGGLTIALGNQRPADTANWLPTPAGACILALRAYEGSAAIVDAQWFPPALESVD